MSDDMLALFFCAPTGAHFFCGTDGGTVRATAEHRSGGNGQPLAGTGKVAAGGPQPCTSALWYSRFMSVMFVTLISLGQAASHW